jgi:putative transposase
VKWTDIVDDKTFADKEKWINRTKQTENLSITCRPFYSKSSPWENGYLESFNGKLRKELQNGEIFEKLTEAKILLNKWRKHYNEIRPHSSIGYKPPAPVALKS